MITESSKIPRIAVMVSSDDHCLMAMLEAAHKQTLGGEIVLILSNLTEVRMLAEIHNIPFIHIDENYYSVDHIELLQLKSLREFNIDLIVMAGYTTAISDGFISQYVKRIITVIPILVSSFLDISKHSKTATPSHKTLGATACYASELLDVRNILSQEGFLVAKTDQVADYILKVQQNEASVLLAGVRVHLQNHSLSLSNRTTVTSPVKTEILA